VTNEELFYAEGQFYKVFSDVLDFDYECLV